MSDEIGYIVVDPDIPLEGEWDTPIRITRAEKEGETDDGDSIHSGVHGR